MRYIPAYCLREGMFLGRDVYGRSGGPALCRGQRLYQNGIETIRELGLQGVYILDDISEDVESEKMIGEELYSGAVRAVRETFFGNSLPARPNRAIDAVDSFVREMADSVSENSDGRADVSGCKACVDYTFYHCVNVSVLSMAVAAQMGYSREELRRLGLGAALHDVGTAFLSSRLLEKTGRLTDREFGKIQQHSLLGYDYLSRQFDLPGEVGRGVLEHHEKLDGSGYPNHAEGGGIGAFARVIAVADAYDALTTDRPYRKALPPSEAMEYLMAGSGTLFDPEVVYHFTRRVAAYPEGTCVRLSSGMIGLVVKNYPDSCLRPRVRILYPKSGEPGEIDLRNDPAAKKITVLGIAPL